MLFAALANAAATWFYVLMPLVSLTPGEHLGWGLPLSPEGEALIAAMNSFGGFIAGFITGATTGAFFPVAFNLIVLIVEPHRQASVSAVLSVIANIAASILPIAMYAVLNSNAIAVEGADAPVYTHAGVLLVVMIPVILLAITGIFTLLLGTKGRSAALQAGARS